MVSREERGRENVPYIFLDITMVKNKNISNKKNSRNIFVVYKMTATNSLYSCQIKVTFFTYILLKFKKYLLIFLADIR